jgi:hypothetical protein
VGSIYAIKNASLVIRKQGTGVMKFWTIMSNKIPPYSASHYCRLWTILVIAFMTEAYVIDKSANKNKFIAASNIFGCL